MDIQPKSFDHLLGKLKLSDKQLKAHFTLYAGYVKKLNEILGARAKADRAAVNYSFGAYSELLRRQPTAYNGTVLHEYYFGNLAPAAATKPNAQTKKLLEASYGSMDAWLADMKAAGLSAHGWALTVYDPIRARLDTSLVYSEHVAGLMADTRIVVALDLWEHAYAIDYGINKGEYLTAFFENLNWDAVNARVAEAVKVRPASEIVAA
ncbi:MAG: hypothetical protein KGO96_04270 [Elusimicrobia bacterium]|nr:hypothetical protein [Elusimicrobiota bacterium]MDE2425108.1 hypothetical protein [Elusimicrobiota bacterium]